MKICSAVIMALSLEKSESLKTVRNNWRFAGSLTKAFEMPVSKQAAAPAVSLANRTAFFPGIRSLKTENKVKAARRVGQNPPTAIVRRLEPALRRREPCRGFPALFKPEGFSLRAAKPAKTIYGNNLRETVFRRRPGRRPPVR